MSNRSIIDKKLKNMGYELGCYDKEIDKIGKEELVKIINNVEEMWTDVEITFKRKPYIVEIATVDNKKDFNLLSKEEHRKIYGNNQ